MESNKVVPALAVFLFMLCAVVGFVAFAFNTLGMEIPFVQEISLPQIGTVLLYLVFVLALAVFSQVLSFWLAKAAEKIVFGFMDKQFLPRKTRGESHTTVHGERLEKVVIPSFYATTVWELITQTIPGLLVVSLVLYGTAVVVAKFSGELLPAVGLFLVALFVNLTVLPWAYWLKEWRRRHTKFVVFTFMTYYVKARTPVVSLLTGLGTLPKTSGTPLKQINEVQISADPEEFDKTIKTSWIRDQYTSWGAKRKNLRTLFLRSVVNDAADVLLWLDNGPGLQNILKRLIENAAFQASEQNYIAEEALKKKLGDTDQENWSLGKTETEVRLYLEKVRGVHTSGIKYDLFRVEDPGLYDDDGNLKEQSVTDIEKESDEESVDVSHLFRSDHGRHRVADLPEDEDPERDRLP